MTAKTRSKKKVMSKIQGIAVPIKWNIPDNIITRFASNMVVQLLENEFKISFFEVSPDIQLGLDNKVPNEVQANCVASVIINAEKLPIFVDALQKQCEVYAQVKSNSMLPIVSNGS
jgi:hypothetical protein